MENPTPNFPKFGDLWMENPTPDSSRALSEDGARATPAQFVSGVDETCGSTDAGPPACNQRGSGPMGIRRAEGGGLGSAGFPARGLPRPKLIPPPLADSSSSYVVGRAEPQRR